MELVKVNGVGLEVQRLRAVGNRKLAPIVFLHEGLGSVAMWRDWPAQVCEATGRAGIVYSRRGYGQSDRIAQVRSAGRLGPEYMHREAVVVLPELLDALEVESPVLIGRSDGGTIALIHASHFKVTACVVMAPHVIVEDQTVEAIKASRKAFESGALRERLLRFHSDVDCAFWQWNDIWLDPAFRSFDIRALCRGIQAPVLALQGQDDPYGSLRQIEDIAPTSGPFSKEVLASCGHSPQRDQAERCSRHIAEFLKPLD